VLSLCPQSVTLLVVAASLNLFASTWELSVSAAAGNLAIRPIMMDTAFSLAYIAIDHIAVVAMFIVLFLLVRKQDGGLWSGEPKSSRSKDVERESGETPGQQRTHA